MNNHYKVGCFNLRRIAALLFFAVVTTVAVLGFVSCDENSAEEVPVGAVVPLAGVHESTGLSMRNGMELAFEEINESSRLDGIKIRLIVEDSRSTSAGAKEAYEKLIEQDGVVAVLGPYTSRSTEEVIALANENKVISFSPTSAASKDRSGNKFNAEDDFIFRSSLTVEHLVPAGVRVAKQGLGYARVATITNSSDTFSRSNLERLKQEFDKYGDVTVVSEQTYTRPSGDPVPDLTVQLTEIKNANPDAVFISALSSGRAEIMAEARRLGIKAPFIVTLLTIQEVNKANDQQDGAAEGAITFTVWTAATDTPENRIFRRNYREKYNQEPNAFAARSYGAARILAQAIAASSTDPQEIRDAMADIRAEDTVFGDFYFDAYGDAVYNPIVGIVRGDRFEVFE